MSASGHAGRKRDHGRSQITEWKEMQVSWWTGTTRGEGRYGTQTHHRRQFYIQSWFTANMWLLVPEVIPGWLMYQEEKKTIWIRGMILLRTLMLGGSSNHLGALQVRSKDILVLTGSQHGCHICIFSALMQLTFSISLITRCLWHLYRAHFRFQSPRILNACLESAFLKYWT